MSEIVPGLPATAKKMPVWLDVFSSLALFMALSIGLFGSVAIPAYEKTFSDFGVTLHPWTAWIFRKRHGFWLLAVAELVFWYVAGAARRSAILSAAACLLTMSLFVLLVFVLNLPVLSAQVWPGKAIMAGMRARQEEWFTAETDARKPLSRPPHTPELAQIQGMGARYNAPCPPFTTSDTVRCSPTRNWCAN
ncbi:hypothetical protein F2P44_25075 [Massilia sp. CCM 8695]|uniref:Uncharacterized protein n=1 Tax=Massilia frigida TaxID=2609281 RepID=A0ABX0NBP7_9BURK|nr:hypothetical protein [Massilia frigida]NHZ82527.1 hypothetical protein [Massilia frigida]